MSKIGIKLEAFETDFDRSGRIDMNASEMEEFQISAYEDGYSAGWDDCIANKLNEEESVRLDVLQKLRGIANSHAQIRSNYLRTVSSILTEAFSKIIDDIRFISMNEFIEKNLHEMAVSVDGDYPCVTVHPDVVNFVNGIHEIEASGAKVVGNSGYSIGQIEICYTNNGASADFGKLFSKISECIIATGIDNEVE